MNSFPFGVSATPQPNPLVNKTTSSGEATRAEHPEASSGYWVLGKLEENSHASFASTLKQLEMQEGNDSKSNSGNKIRKVDDHEVDHSLVGHRPFSDTRSLPRFSGQPGLNYAVSTDESLTAREEATAATTKMAPTTNNTKPIVVEASSFNSAAQDRVLSVAHEISQQRVSISTTTTEHAAVPKQISDVDFGRQQKTAEDVNRIEDSQLGHFKSATDLVGQANQLTTGEPENLPLKEAENQITNDPLDSEVSSESREKTTKRSTEDESFGNNSGGNQEQGSSNSNTNRGSSIEHEQFSKAPVIAESESATLVQSKTTSDAILPNSSPISLSEPALVLDANSIQDKRQVPPLLRSVDAATQVSEAIKTQFTSFEKESIQSLKLDLHPPELGQLQINIEQSPDRLVAHITAVEFISSELLLQEKNVLLNALADLGFGDTTLDISHGSSGQHDAESHQDAPVLQQYASSKIQSKENRIAHVSTSGVDLMA